MATVPGTSAGPGRGKRPMRSGAYANAWRSSLESAGEPRALHLCHFTVGLNPHAKMTNRVIQAEHVVGAVTFGYATSNQTTKVQSVSPMFTLTRCWSHLPSPLMA